MIMGHIFQIIGLMYFIVGGLAILKMRLGITILALIIGLFSGLYGTKKIDEASGGGE